MRVSLTLDEVKDVKSSLEQILMEMGSKVVPKAEKSKLATPKKVDHDKFKNKKFNAAPLSPNKSNKQFTLEIPSKKVKKQQDLPPLKILTPKKVVSQIQPLFKTIRSQENQEAQLSVSEIRKMFSTGNIIKKASTKEPMISSVKNIPEKNQTVQQMKRNSVLSFKDRENTNNRSFSKSLQKERKIYDRQPINLKKKYERLSKRLQNLRAQVVNDQQEKEKRKRKDKQHYDPLITYNRHSPLKKLYTYLKKSPQKLSTYNLSSYT